MRRFASALFIALVRLTVSLVLLAGVLGPAGRPARAAVTFNVNSTLDEPDAAPGNGACVSTPSGFCTLRAAIMEANALAGADTINVPGGTYTLTRVGVDDDALNGDLDILDDVTITGAGPNATVIDGNGSLTTDRVLQVGYPIGSPDTAAIITGVQIKHGAANQGGGIHIVGSLTLSNSTVFSNTASSSGGGISNSGALTLINSAIISNTGSSGGGIANGNIVTLTNSIVSGNRAPGGSGGGILNIAVNPTLTLSNSTISGNTASGNGGGIHNPDGTVHLTGSGLVGNAATAGGGGGLHNGSGTVTVLGSTVSGNTATSGGLGNGGGLFNNAGFVVVTNSTVSGNFSNLSGGGLYLAGGETYLFNATIANNAADADNNDASNGGGIKQTSTAAVLLRNTLVADNEHYDSLPFPIIVPDDCKGTFTSGGYNLIYEPVGCTLDGSTTGNITGQFAVLGPLQDNGGPTQTHALAANSPALDAGDPAGCTTMNDQSITTDQRGSPRHADGDFSGGARCDIGAFEFLGSLFLPLIMK